jgi:DNA-binding transcriptional MerR regulator
MALRIHEFAELAGVTVKALHHYDRVGLLRPRRAASGYRVYEPADLERLEHIVALKFIGLPLKDIRRLLDRGAPALTDALRLQRQVLEEKRQQITRAVEAIAAAERAVAGGEAPAAAVLTRLIEAITIEQNTGILKEYFGEEAWSRWKTRRSLAARREWQGLYADIGAALTEDIRSPAARALADRWLELVEREAGGDPSIRTGLIKAWTAGHRLPALLLREPGDPAITRATRFVADVLWARWDDERRARPPNAAPHKVSDSRIALFKQTEALLGTDPSAAEAQQVAANWDRLLDREAGGDPETVRMMRESLDRRASWPEGMRRYVASLYGTTPARWREVTEFVERARARRH